MDSLCIRCKGKGLCGKPCKILAKFRNNAPSPKLHFSGPSPPEIFVGRINYPNVFSGILAPTEHCETKIPATPEQWIKKNLSIEKILELRGQLIYGRGISHIKTSSKLKQITQELALSSKPVSTEFFLKQKPTFQFTTSKIFSIMTNPAPIKKVILEENPTIEKKVDYLTSDYDVKATEALKELYKSNIQITHLQKLLSAGLLGVKSSRKMTPTRWSITAIDDTISKQLLKKIRYYQDLNEIQLFHNYYNGNHFEILLLPEKFSFEVIEVATPGNIWGGTDKTSYSQDYEGFYPRKKYATQVAGAYYSDRLGICEYLEKIKRQATCIVFHEEREEYYAPLGVGIIRESVRKAMTTKPENPESVETALKIMASRLQAPIEEYKKRSWVLNNYKKQKKLGEFF